MIETTEAINDEGVRFLSRVRFVEPYDYENGVWVEKVSRRTLDQVPETALLLKSLGLKKVGFDHRWDTNVYALYPLGYIQYKVIRHALTGYWWLVRFLYNNARMFQQISSAECFSWKYFTPYVWIKKLQRRMMKKSFNGM